MPVATEADRRPSIDDKISQPRDIAAWVAFGGLLAASCAWILSLPVFPSQDGAAHVYYARVTRDLLMGRPGFGLDYHIARYFPPYSVHAYLLMLLRQWAQPELAEKLLACLCVIVGGIGVAYLARQVGRSATVIAALAVPFLLHRWVFTGFYGYDIGIGLALIALGLWVGEGTRSFQRRAAFLGLTVLTLFSHPVPYLLLLFFGWTAVLAAWWNARTVASQDKDMVPAYSRGDWLTVLLASGMFLYVRAYSRSGPLWDNELLADQRDKLFRIIGVFQTRDELPLHVPLYNWVLGAVLLSVTIAACWKARQGPPTKITRQQMVVAWAFAILIALPLLPRTMNGSGFFAERFSIWPPLLFFAAASGIGLSRRVQRALLPVAAILTAFTLAILGVHVRPIAEQMDLSGTPRGELKGVRLIWRNESPAPRDLLFDPFLFASVRVVDREDAILINGPWLDLQIMMLQETEVASKSGLAITRCGDVRGQSSAEQSAALHPERWRLRKYACFDVLEPVP